MTSFDSVFLMTWSNQYRLGTVLTHKRLYTVTALFLFKKKIIWDNEETTVGQVSFQFLSRIFRTEILESATHPYNDMPI